MPETRCISAGAESAGIRVDRFLAEKFPELSRSAFQKMAEEGQILSSGRVVGKNFRLRGGEELKITFPDLEELEAKPENIPLEIVYEDSDLLVVNKQKGMVVHPAAGNPCGTLVNALLYHCKGSLSGINGVLRPGIVHRIDKNTSGLLIVAKNDTAHRGLAEQIQDHSFLREYETVVYGRVKTDCGLVNEPIGRSRKDRKKMCVTYENSKPALTHYQVLERYESFSHLRCRLETGRTHQIRVHMAYIHHPVAGDEVYGPQKVIASLQGQCLHAKTIGFIHPCTGKELFFNSPLPDYFVQFQKQLQRQGGAF